MFWKIRDSNIRLLKMRIAFYLVAIAISGACTAGIDLHPLSEEYINFINSQQSTWTAGRNFDANTPMSYIRGLLGVLDYPEAMSEYKKLRVQQHTEDLEIPESFDARENWPECETIKMIRDQSHCGSCWAVSATSVMSDRICIHSNGTRQVYVSDEDLLSCCTTCGNGCKGGFVMESWNYWLTQGISSGGPYNSTTGCKAYSIAPCPEDQAAQCRGNYNDTPKCKKRCDSGSSLDYESDKSYGQVPYGMSRSIEQIQMEIMKNGPLQILMNVYDDFFSYKSGVYQRVSDKFLAGHAVRAIGWGTENGIPYWLIANSWNDYWGENGLFKIRRGVNECGIESFCLASLPKL